MTTKEFKLTVEPAVSTDLRYHFYVYSGVSRTDLMSDVQAEAWARGMDQLQVMSPPRAGQASAALRNDEGTYNPESSPLEAGQVVELVAEYNGTVYPLWSGILDHPQQRGPQFVEQVHLTEFGTLSRLADKRGLTSGLYVSLRTDEAIDVILDAAQWPSDKRILDTGATVLRYWHLDGEDAFAALRVVLNSEGLSAQIYEDAEGNIVFRNRHAIFVDTRSKVAQASYGPSNLPMTEPWAYEDGLRDEINTASVKVERRIAGDLQVVWESRDPVDFAPDQTRKFRVRLTDTLLMDARTPIEGVDYTVVDGSLASVELDRTSGASVEITITAGVDGAELDPLQLRAKPITKASETEISNTNHPLEADETPRPYPLEVWPGIDPLVAQDFVDVHVELYRGGRPQVRFSTINLDDASLVSLLEREIGDRVHVEIPRLGIDEDVIILERADSLGMGKIQRATFGCEEIIDMPVFIADVSRADIDPVSF